MSNLSNFISLFGTTLLIPLIVIMHRRGQRTVFPCFFVYLIVVLFRCEGLLLTKPFYPAAYFYGYWITEAITILFSFTVIYEIYSHILTSGTLPVSPATFFRLSVGLLLFASIVAALTVHTVGHHPVLRIIFVLSSALRIMQVSMFAVLATLSIFFGFYWTGQAFGIALGYALFALSQLTNTLARAWAGPLGDQAYVYVTMFGYDCAVLIWLAYALKGQSQVRLNSVPENNTAVWFGALERLAK